VAALVAEKIKVDKNDTVCTVLCGGNIDPNLLTRVIEQVMARQGRYIMLKLMVLDRPGALAPLTAEIARSGANIIEIFHRRALWLAPLGHVGVELILEVRDRKHGREVEKHLESVGYHVQREVQGDWAD
jgi:threonine dehydratase